jgi:hypothetical protein
MFDDRPPLPAWRRQRLVVATPKACTASTARHDAAVITLTPADVAALDAVGGADAGERYPEGAMRTINR